MARGELLFLPFKDGEWLRNSRGNSRIYKTLPGALRNLKKLDYDSVLIYSNCVNFTKEEFEALEFETSEGEG